MKKSTKGILLGTSVFLGTNILLSFSQKLGETLQNLDSMGTFLSLNLLISGFITGRYIGAKGFKYGALVSVVSYISTCLIILIYLFVKYVKVIDSTAELILSLSKFSPYLFAAMIPVMLVASLISGTGGLLGQKYAELKK